MHCNATNARHLQQWVKPTNSEHYYLLRMVFCTGLRVFFGTSPYLSELWGWLWCWDCLLECYSARRACALRALGLLLADSALTVGRGKTFWCFNRSFFTKTAVTWERSKIKSTYTYELTQAQKTGVSPKKWPIARKRNFFRGGPSGKIVALGILKICPVNKNCNHYTKNWLLAPLPHYREQYTVSLCHW